MREYKYYFRSDDQKKVNPSPFWYGLSDEGNILAKTEKEAYQLAVLRFTGKYSEEKLDSYCIGIGWRG